MTRQNINIGTSEGQGDGDSLRAAFQKINDNFTELYSGALRGFTGSGGYNGYSGSTGYVGSVGLAANAAVTNFGTFLNPSGYTLQVRRGSILDRTSFTPAAGEIIYSTDTKRLYVGDGVTPGGRIISGTVGYTGSGGGGAGGGYTGSIGLAGYTGSPGASGGGGIATTSTLINGTATLRLIVGGGNNPYTLFPEYDGGQLYIQGSELATPNSGTVVISAGPDGGNIFLNTYGASPKQWAFNNGGVLNFPDGTTSTGATIFVPYDTSSSFKITTIDDNMGMGPYTPLTFQVNGNRIILPNGNGLIQSGSVPGVWSLDSLNKYFQFPNGSLINYGTGGALSTGSLEVLVYDDVGGTPNTNFIINLFTPGKKWTFDNSGSLTIPGDIHGSGADAVVVQNTASGVAYLELPVDPSNDDVILANQDPGGVVTLRAGDFGSEKDWRFDANGRLTLASNLSIDPLGLYAPAYGTRMWQKEDEILEILSTGTSGATAIGWVNNLQTAAVFANSPLNPQSVGIFVGSYTATLYSWVFSPEGKIFLPGMGVIQENQITNELFGTTTTSLSLYPGGSSQVNQRLEIYATVGGEGDHLHLTAGDQTGTDLYLGNDSQYVKISGTGGQIDLQARDGLAAPSPGTPAGSGSDINIYAGDAGSNNGNPNDGAAAGSVYIMSGFSSTGTGGVVQIASGYGPAGYGFVEITTNGYSNNWKFSKDNELIFPSGGNILFDSSSSSKIYGLSGIEFADGTTSTTAFIANQIGLTWSISASGASDYVFSGPGIYAGNENDPILYLYRGFTYKFINTTGGSHPFAIRVSNGGAAYTTGVSGSQTGTQTFTVPMDAPSTLYYQCTIHSGMGNTINIV